MKLKKWSYSIFFLCLCITAIAQSPHFRSHPFDKVLGNIQPTVIFQDSIGRHWVGTQQGLFYFDGQKYIELPIADSLSQHVTTISEINNQLWVGFDDGQIRFLENGISTLFEPEEGLPTVRITDILEDKNGVLWFSTYGEGVYYRYKNRLYNINMDDGLLGDDIYTMTLEHSDNYQDGRVWVGTDNGISICYLKNGKKQVENLTLEDGLSDMIIKKIAADEVGNMWIGTYEKGISKYDIQQKTFQHFSENWRYGVVRDLTIFEKKEVWIGTERQGLVRLNIKDGQFSSLATQASSKILDTHKDIEGNLWVISNRNGVQSANKQFEYLSTDLQNIQAVLCTQRGEQLIGTQKGLFKYNPITKTFQPTAIQENIIALYEDKFGIIWVGTFGNGLILFSLTTSKVRRITTQNGLPNGSILAIKGNDKMVWLATLGGVVQYDLARSIFTQNDFPCRIFDKKDGLGASYVYDIFMDNRGRTWFGTDGKGITVFENGIFKNHATANGRALKTIYSITEDQQENIWFSTAKDGIYKFDGTVFQHFSYSEGLRDLEINGLVADEKGNILILHPTGIDLLDPLTNHLIYYDTEVGIEMIDPNLNVFDTDKNGNIWLGTKTGIVQYFPLTETLEIHPHTILQQVSIYLEPIDFQAENNFSYQQNYLTFEFIGLWYTDPKAVQYRYRLKGYDLDWNYTRDLRTTYPNLPAGTYIFEVQSSENEGFEGVPTVTYAFCVRLPFWKTTWFVGLCLLTIGGFVYWWVKFREQRLKKEEALKKEKIEFELQTLKSQVNPHFLFNSFNTLLAIVEDDTQLAAEYVEKLSDFYRNILQYQEQSVVALEEELELLDNYFYLLKKRHGDNLKLNIQITDKQIYQYLPPLTLQMLVENAVKHNIVSKSKPLTIVINGNLDNQLSIKNNLQPKKTPPVSTHFGLKSIQKRYELLDDRTIEIQKTTQDFEVIIPLLKKPKV